MHKKNIHTAISILLLVMPLLLSACSGSKQTYLPIEASLVDKGTTKAEVTKMLGPPSAVVEQPDGTEEWYYFDDKTWFWQHTPLIGKYLGDKRVESLQIILKRDRVVSATYYVQKLS
jgi:outer membrane protein assembly factor BamE (lipoprotein component of BamABCDE complex)